MCLVVFAWRTTPRRRLVLVANRDELHARPTAPVHWWPGMRLLAGRDLDAGGTWLGVDERGRFGAITNFRGGPAPPAAPSRGTLIPRFLGGRRSPADFLAELAATAAHYAGFSLLVADEETLGYYCNRSPEPARLLGPGIYGLSNATLDAPWPKLVRSRDRLAAAVENALEPERLLALLADRAAAPDPDLPDTGVGLELERRLSAPFIVDPHYGTRSTTALLLDDGGRGMLTERSFAPDGAALGTVHFELPAARRD